MKTLQNTLESEERFRTMVDSIPQLAWIAQADGYILWYNQRWYEYTGTTPAQMEGRGWQNVHDPLMLPKVLEQWRASIALGEAFEMEFPLRGTDGRFRRFLTRVLPHKDAEGHVVQWFGTNTDIDEHKRAEEEIRRLNADLERRVIERTAQLQAANVALNTEIGERKRGEEIWRKSEEGFRLLVEGVQEYAIFMLSPEGNVVSWNKGAERIKGYKLDEIIGTHFSCFYPPEAIAQGKPEEELRTAVEQGQTNEEGWRVRKDGQQFWANVVIRALFDNDGSLQGFAKISRDMTEAKRIEKALSDKNIELEAASEAKDRFLASMSHELRTPLNAILGFTGTLLMRLPGPLTAGQQKQLETIKVSAQLQLSLINDLLDLAKIESGKVEPNLEWVACRRVLEEITQTLRPLADAKGLNFDLQLPGEDEVFLRTDRRALSQILINLINNAIKFTDQGTVEICLRKTDDAVEIAVTDTGVGIKPEDQAKLFEAFTRLNGRVSHRPEGTGLGLHLSQKLAALLGGRIQFESVHGKGSTFSLAIPRANEQA
jgi:PAS domain S-box-containing protein